MTKSLTPLDSDSNYSVCIIGKNAKSVAAAMALTYFGIPVCFYGFSETADEHIAKYSFDTPLCQQWHNSIASGSVTYRAYDQEYLDKDFNAYWLFLDQLPKDFISGLVAQLSHTRGDVFMSGVVSIGQVAEFAQRLTSNNVFYIPFVFLCGSSVFVSTIAPKILLIGEKHAHTALKNPLINTFILNSLAHHITDIKTIEFTRSCMINLMASKLSLLNKMAQLADMCSVDMQDVEQILKLDERLGKGFLQAGWGYGGSTLPKENKILKQHFSDLQMSSNIVQEIEQINNNQKEVIFQKFWRYFESDISNKVVVIWGAGYKRGTGRTKGSAIHTILPLLWAYNVVTYVYDPLAKNELNEKYKNNDKLKYIETPYERIDQTDALFVINWSYDERPNINLLNASQVPVFDAKNLFNKREIQQLSSYYTGIGRGIK